MEVTLKPKLTFHQVIQMNTQGNDVKTETYFTEDTLYILEPTSGQWMKMPMDPTLLQTMQQNNTNLSKQLESFKAYSDDFTVIPKADAYELKISASGDKLQALVQEQLEKLASGQDSGINLDAMKIKNVEMLYVIDKTTFHPKSYDMKMDLEMAVNQNNVSMNMDMSATYEKINEISEIKLPAEALSVPSM
jgi:hypothetical protein